jgi:hypothetical protein
MADYSLEVGEYVNELTCSCCGEKKKRVWGFVSKDGSAHAVYYALLNITEEQPRVGLTLSVGPWWENSDPRKRTWIHLEVWSESDGFHMNIRNPKESNFYPWEKGGKPYEREEAKRSDLIDEFWSVADFIVESDRAVSSYLNGERLDETGRAVRNLDSAPPSAGCR